MKHQERKLLIRNALLGLTICLSMVVVHALGWTESLERWSYDIRAQTCQFDQSPPTDQLLHLDIDDSTLEEIGAWPWPREVLAKVIDELTTAQAKVIALDVIFPEPQKPRIVQDRETDPISKVEDDKLLAHALEQSGRSLLSVSVEIESANTQRESLIKSAVKLINENIDINRDDFEQQLRKHPLFNNIQNLSLNLDSLFIRTRQQVLYDRSIALLKTEPTADFFKARQVILPHLDVNLIGGSPLLNALSKQFDRAQSMTVLHRYATPLSQMQEPAVKVEPQLPPIAILSDAAMGGGFVTYLPDADGVVRSVPLGVFDGEKVLPQLGLAMTCAYMGVHPRDILFKQHHVEITKPDGTVINLPVHQQQVDKVNRTIHYLYDVPWFGPVDHWQHMYDPMRMQTRQHLPLYAVYRIDRYRQSIVINNRQIDKAISMVLDDDAEDKLKLNPDLGRSYRDSKPAADDSKIRQQMIVKLKADEFVSAVYSDFMKLKDDELSNEDHYFKQTLKDAYHAMDEASTLNEQWEKQIADAQTQLKNQVAGKAVIIGWTGTATIADFVQTSLHHKCPGVVVHGAIFNAILTGASWTRVPVIVNIACMLIMGLVATILVARLSPIWALSGCLGISAVYFAINGMILFDKMNLLVEIASPLLTVGLVWSGCTLNRFIVERTERARIQKQFSSYVDPALVDYVVNHPEARFDGELKEMTVVFTDLAGFTTLSEKLRERTVTILNEYMSLMVPIIRQHAGYLNKFLGDGIMFFYSAPQDNPHHAIASVKTALAMQHAMIDFNRKLHTQDLPQVSVRIGISTGNMVVGNAGSVAQNQTISEQDRASDYTVLGDSVNLGARLESANKYTGTAILINDTCKQQLGDTFLLRPVGKLQVVGKSESIMTWEPLCQLPIATDRQKQIATLAAPIVEHFADGAFDACNQAINAYEAALGHDKFSQFYHRQCDRHQQHPEDFNGCIVLEAK